MTDKNGIEIKTGAIVEITGAYFKNNNGLYFVTSSPEDPTWSGRDHCMKKISKRGKISTAKYNICFWPIKVFVSDRWKAAAANKWNKEHAQIEVKSLPNMDEVVAYFQGKAEALKEDLQRVTRNFGEDSATAQKDRDMIAHYEAVAARI